MARDYYNEVTNRNSFSKNTQKKKKKDEKTEVVKKPQSSVSTKQPVRQTDTGTGSRRTASVSRGSQQAANQVTNAASQVMQRRSERNKPAQTAKQMQEQRQAKRLENENVRKQNAAEWETVKNKSKAEQQAWFTEKAKEAQVRRGGKVSEGTDNLATSAFKAAAHGAKGAVHSLSGALERASMNDTAEAYRFKFDEMRKGTSEAEAEKIGLQKAQQRQEARLAGYREKTKLEQQKIETIQNREAAKDKGPIPLRKMTVGAATFTGQRLVDSALGPYSLLSMGARVIEDERNSGKEKNDQLKKSLAESGQFSQEELDETFAQLDRKAVANAYASSGIEVLSELMFGGIGLSKKYLPKGASGMLDKAADKLFGRLGTSAAGRIALGIGEETAEEWIANPLQAAVSNRLTGNTLQSLQEESVRRTYQDQARSLEEIQATSADINSKAFLDRAKEIYKEAGASDEEATQIAELARDYFNADITGDSKTAEEKLNQITDILAGGENDLREKWTLKDALEVAGEMIISVGAEATPGAISMSTSGGQYKANYGIEGVRKLAKVVENLDDEKSDRAKAIIDDIDNGKDISNTQVAMLMEWSNNAALKAQDREITRDQIVQRKMRDENLLVPIVDTEYNLAPATEERFEQIVENVADIAQEDMGLDMDDVDAYAIGDVVAAYETGTISAEQMNELNIENPENRAVFEKATGIDLNQYTVKDANGNIKVAASNTAMQKALFAKAADNYIKSARIEQENWNEVERGQAYERLTSNDMGGRGDMAISRVLESVDPRNRGEFLLAGSVARRVYEHARMTDDSWDEVKKDFTNTFSSGMNESMKYVYEMAKADKAIAENKYYGKVVESGEKATKSSLKEQAYVPGKFTNESERMLKSSELSVLTSVASELGLNVIMTDSLDSSENGRYMYKSRTIMLNSQNTMDENLEAIFSHEVTHHLAAYAPDEYLKLSRLVMDKYYKSDRDSFMKEIKEKQDLYKKAKGQELTPEEALEEMIADGSRDFWQDQEFIDAVTQEEPTLAKKILDSIKDILRKLRNILSSGNITDEQTREGFFNQINAYDEAYRLWLNAYNAARSAQATEAINETQDQINERYSIEALSDGTQYVKLDGNLFLKEDGSEMTPREAFNSLVGKRITLNDGDVVTFIKRLPNKFDGYKELFRRLPKNKGFNDLQEVKDINEAINKNIEEVLQASENISPNEQDVGGRHSKYNIQSFDTREVYVADDNAAYRVELSVATMTDGTKFAYAKKFIEPDNELLQKIKKAETTSNNSRLNQSSIDNIAVSTEDVKYSISEQQDKEYMDTAKEYQKLYEADDPGWLKLQNKLYKMVDEAAIANGYNIKAYHGTDSEPFNVFDRDKLRHGRQYGDGFYFSPYEEVAGEYGQDVYEYYLKGNGQELGEFYGAQDYRDFDTVEEAEKFFDEKYKQFVQNGQGIERFRPEARRVDGKYRVIYTTIGSFQNDVILVATEPEYIKSAEPITYDDEGNIIPLRERFNEDVQDIRFSLNEPVERVKDLIAVHNLKPTDIINTFKLGGFPMPSIAVTKDSMGHELYGDITLMFHSDTIDPKASRYNQVFGGDAWTPTFPSVSNKINRRVADSIDQKLRDVLGLDRYDYALGDLRLPALDDDNLTNSLRNNEPYEAFKNDEVFQLAYLKNAKNFDVAVPTKEGTIRNLDKQALEYLDDMLPELSYDDIYDTVSHTMEYEPAVREARKAYYENKGGVKLKVLAKMLDDELGYNEVISRLEATIKFRENGIPEITDRDALRSILNDNVDQEGYKAWIDNLFEGIIEKTGIRNDKDMFTNSGNRRSWEALHDPVTLDNVVKAMRSELAAGGGILGNNPKGAAQKRYNSLDELRADEDRLQQLPEEEYEAQSKAAVGKMSEVCIAIADHNPGRFDSTFGAALDVGSYIAEILNSTRKRSSIQGKLRSDYNIDVTEDQMDDLMEAIDAIANIPTGYFEAKPRRAVGFNEVKAAIIPSELKWTDGMYDEIRKGFEEYGVPVYEYDYSKEGDRQRVVNEAATEQDLRFSISEDSNGRSLTESQQMYFNNSKVLDDEGRLKVMYHGTPNIGFTVFDYSKAYPGTLGRGFYFSDTPSHAGVYGQSIEVYLNIANPLTAGTNDITKDQLRAFVERLAEDEDYGIENYGYGSTVDSVTESVWGGTDFQMMHDLNLSCVGDLAEACKIFNEVNGTDYDGIITPVETLAMRPEQIKFTDNLDPTSDIDMRYSLDDEYMAAVESGDMETAQRLVDEAAKMAGYTEDLYHGTGEYFNVFKMGREGIHLGNMEQASQISRQRYHDRSQSTRYTYDEILENFDKLNNEDKIKLAEAADRAKWLHTSALRDTPDFNTENFKDKDLKDYIKTIADEYGKHNIYPLGFELPTFDRKVGENLMHLYAKINNPFVIENDLLDWTPYYIAEVLLQRADGKTNMESRFEAYGGGTDMDISGSEFNPDDMARMDLQRLSGGLVKGDQAWQLLDEILYWNGGYDGIKYLNKYEGDKNSYSYIALNRNAVKSADTVTYAEDGSVIPLSERFDSSNPDIRYSLPTQDTNGKVLSDGQMEYFKNSQARGLGGRLAVVYHSTRNGGFTIFDPAYSDDKRSIFFTDSLDMSQSYSGGGEEFNAMEFGVPEPGELNNLQDVVNYFNSLRKEKEGWWGDNLYIKWWDGEEGYSSYADAERSSDNTLQEFVDRYGIDGEGMTGGYIEDADGHTIGEFDNIEELLKEVKDCAKYINDEFGTRGREETGTYACYLNLEDPLIIECNGANWDSIREPDFEMIQVSIIENEDGEIEYRVLNNGSLTDIDYFNSLDDLRETLGDGFADQIEELDERILRLGYGAELFTWQGGAFDPEEEGHWPMEGNTRFWCNEAEAMGYDGVIFRDLQDYGQYSRGYGSGGDVYVAFSSEQIKDTNNLNPTEDPDIRYSVVDDDEAMSYAAHDDAYDDSWEALEYYESVLSRMVDVDLDDGFINHPMQVFLENLKKYGETDAKARRGKDKSKYRPTKYNSEEDWTEAFYAGLTWQANEMRFDDPILEEGRTRMAKSRNDFFNSTVAKWNQGWVTEGSVLDINSIRKPVRDLVAATMQGSDTDRKYNSDTVKKTLIDMRLAYWYAQQGRIEIADALLWHTAHRMIENVEFYADDSVFNEYKDLRQYLRTTRIQLGEEYWADVDYQAFRKANFGRLKLVSGETNVDQIYAELEELFPGLFNSEEYTTPPDQLMHIAAVLDSIQPYKEAYSSEECAALATEIASDLLDIMQNEGQAIESVADKYEAKIQAMRTRHAEAMLKVREQRDRGIKAEKAKFKEYVAKQKEKTLHKKHYQSIQKNYKKLTERLLTNTADKNIPEQYKKELAKLLGAFDLQTVGSKKYEARTGRKSQKTIRMGAMIAALSNIESKSGEFHVNDAITDIIDELLGKDTGNGHNRSIEGLTIDELNSSELARIDNLLKALLHEFNTYKTVKVKAKRQQVEDIGKAQVDSALKHAEDFGFGKDYNGAVGILDKIVNLDEMTASYLFRRIDPENEGLGLMYRELRLSFDHYVRNTAQLNQWMEQILGKYQNRGKGPRKYGSDQIHQWRSYNYARTLNLENGSVQLTPAQMMSIYCLAKRPQAYNHMTGAGIVVAPNRYDAKFINDIKQKISTALPVKLTDADIKLIENELTPDQMKVASDLQQLMANQMAAWGNEASMNVLGIELFNEPDYFPIKSDRAALISDLSEDQFAEAIRSFGFTKAVQPGAKNAIMVDDIFAVVAEHCNNMNLYNSYSEAINDFMKVYNYRDVDESRGEYTVKQAIAHAYSEKATAFIGRFIKDLNGNVSGNDTGINKMYNDLLSKAKKASVFANGRVALQQPTAIARAFYVINPKYLKGIVTNEKAVQGAMQEMFDHCPIALWKSWGYYDIQMGRSVEDVMMNNGNWFEDLETDLYGRLDNVTWTAIWQMVKAEMKDTHPDVKPGTDEYWELCNERMSEVVDLTQVVDSPMHRSHAMRAKDYVSKTATAFMAEPTLTFNMVKDGLIQAKEALQKGDKAKAGSIFGKTVAVFITQAVLVSAMAAIWDAIRGKNPSGDDDDDVSRFKLWWLNTLENFKGELAIWNKVYFVKDISSLFQGYGVNNMALQGWKSVADGCAQLFGLRNVYSSKKWYENLLTGAGYITGQPYGTLFKDLKAIYNMFGLDWEVFNSIGGYLDETQDKFSEMFGKKDEDSVAAGFWAVFDGKKNGASSQEDEQEGKSDNKKSSGSEEETAEDIKSLSAEQLKKLDKKAAEKVEGYTGSDRDEVLWDVLSEGYTKHIEAGDMDYIYKLRVLYQQHGGNIDVFNTKVANAMPSIYKKTFKANMTEEEISNQEEMKEFMLRYGMSEAEVSDICYHTDMAKDLKAALRMGNREYIIDELVPLIRAGLTREDFEKLYKNRNRGANTYSGKYTDEKYRQSTGNFVWPTEGTITSGFGYRESPTAGASSNHMGIDIGAALGTPVVAVDGGVVIEAGANGGYGNSVGIKHDDGTISYYNHLYNWNVQVGDAVGQGQQIGQVGSTGISTGPHLDFRLYKDGDYLNPMDYLNKRS